MDYNTNNQYLKKFSSLFVGLLFVQIINLLFSLLLPIYFSPQDFAIFGIFTSILFILIELVNAKLDIAVMLANDNKEAKDIAIASFTAALAATLIILMFTIPFVFYYGALIYILLPFTLFIYGINQPILVYLNRIEKYKSINIFRIIQVLSTCFFTLILAIVKIKHALIIGFFIGLLAATLYIMQFITVKINVTLLKEKLKKFDQFAKYGTISSLLNNISRNSIPIILAHFFAQQLVGFYSYSTRLLNAPTGMYNSALSQIYFKMASNTDTSTLKKETHKIIRFTFLIGLIPTLVLLFFGKQIFYLLFSGEWQEAGIITQYLILWYFTGVIVGPISFLLDVKNKLKFEFNYNVAMCILRIIAIMIGGLLQNYYISILLFSLVGICMNLFLLYYIEKKLLKID